MYLLLYRGTQMTMFSCEYCVCVFCIKVVAEVVVLTCANVVGFHQRSLTDKRHQRTFTHIRNYIQSRVTLENERQQQVCLSLTAQCSG